MAKKLPERTQIVNGARIGSRGSIPKPFMDRVFKMQASDCWIWLGRRVTGGYGTTWFRGATWRAHRASWVLHRGPIPDGMLVLHRCDAPACVNPEHLFLGTQSENALDCLSKGRHISQTRRDLIPRGERASKAKLTAAQVREIRRLAGIVSERQLARNYGVTAPSIHNIIHRKSWRHI